MTRDRIETAATLFDLRFRLIDTPGLDDRPAIAATTTTTTTTTTTGHQSSHLNRDLLIQSQVRLSPQSLLLFMHFLIASFSIHFGFSSLISHLLSVWLLVY
jgi:hypothetical protein